MHCIGQTINLLVIDAVLTDFSSCCCWFVAVWMVLQFMGWGRQRPGGRGTSWAGSNLRNEWAAACQSREPRYSNLFQLITFVNSAVCLMHQSFSGQFCCFVLLAGCFQDIEVIKGPVKFICFCICGKNMHHYGIWLLRNVDRNILVCSSTS